MRAHWPGVEVHPVAWAGASLGFLFAHLAALAEDVVEQLLDLLRSGGIQALCPGSRATARASSLECRHRPILGVREGM